MNRESTDTDIEVGIVREDIGANKTKKIYSMRRIHGLYNLFFSSYIIITITYWIQFQY